MRALRLERPLLHRAFRFPKGVWAELFDAGRITFHPVFPRKPGFAARAIEDADDGRDVIALLRISHERVVARYGLAEDVS